MPTSPAYSGAGDCLVNDSAKDVESGFSRIGRIDGADSMADVAGRRVVTKKLRAPHAAEARAVAVTINVRRFT